MLEKARWAEENATLMNNAKGSEPATIGDDLCRRIWSVGDHLMILNERLAVIANKVMGPGPDETAETANGELADQLYPPLIERLSSGIFLLERRAIRIQETIDRFSGLV